MIPIQRYEVSFSFYFGAKSVRYFFYAPASKALYFTSGAYIFEFYIYTAYKAFRDVETLFVQGQNLVPSRPAIG